MKKGEYYVFCVHGTDHIVETREGYIDEELNIGYSHLTKDGYDIGYWNATDLNSGFIMATAKTRKECIENAIKNIPMVNEKMLTDDKLCELVEEFRMLKLEKECEVA